MIDTNDIPPPSPLDEELVLDPDEDLIQVESDLVPEPIVGEPPPEESGEE